MRRSIKFLGHIVDKDGLHMDPDKVKAITEAKIPTNKKGIRSWTGMVNYYRHFVKGYWQDSATFVSVIGEEESI